MAVPQATVRKVARVSRQSQLSTNDKSDIEMIPGAVHKSPGTAEENPGKPQLGDPLMKAVPPGRRKERRKG